MFKKSVSLLMAGVLLCTTPVLAEEVEIVDAEEEIVSNEQEENVENVDESNNQEVLIEDLGEQDSTTMGAVEPTIENHTEENVVTYSIILSDPVEEDVTAEGIINIHAEEDIYYNGNLYYNSGAVVDSIADEFTFPYTLDMSAGYPAGKYSIFVNLAVPNSHRTLILDDTFTIDQSTTELSFVVSDTEPDPVPHVMSKWSKDPNSDYISQSCTICGMTMGYDVSSGAAIPNPTCSGHDWSPKYPLNYDPEAYFSSDYYFCYNCGAVRINSTASPIWAAHIPATCTEAEHDENHEYRNDGYEKIFNSNYKGEPLGHSYGDWVVVQEPTTEKTGLKIHTCTRVIHYTDPEEKDVVCGHVEQEVIPKLSPNPDTGGNNGNSGNTGTSGNTGNTGNSGSGNTGNNGNTGNSGNTGNTSSTGNTGNNSNVTKPNTTTTNTGNSGSTGNTGNSSNVTKPNTTTTNTGNSGNAGNKSNVKKPSTTSSNTSNKTNVAPVVTNGITVTAKGLSGNDLTIKKGKSVKLKVKVPKTKKKKGKKAKKAKVKFKSSNKKVATVSKSGKIKAKKPGTAYITISVNGKKRKIKVVVVKKKR